VRKELQGYKEFCIPLEKVCQSVEEVLPAVRETMKPIDSEKIAGFCSHI
jgi:hypothetical protein